MTRLWFRAKRYGWGWYPVTKEGWLVTLGYIAVILVGELLFIDSIDKNPSIFSNVGFFLYAISATTILMAICFKKGEKPRWRWGK